MLAAVVLFSCLISWLLVSKPEYKHYKRYDRSIFLLQKSLQSRSQEYSHCDTKRMFTDGARKSIDNRKAACSGRRQRGRRERGETWCGGPFITDDTCVLMAFAEWQRTTMTNRTSPRANQHWSAGAQRQWEHRGMLQEGGHVGKQKADVPALGSASLPPVHYLWRHVERSWTGERFCLT